MFYHVHVKLWVQTRKIFGMNGYCRPRRRVIQILREEFAEKIDEEVLRACVRPWGGKPSSRNKKTFENPDPNHKPSAVFFLMGLTRPYKISHAGNLTWQLKSSPLTGFEINCKKKGGE
jgi:hypothetical protein